MAAASSITIFSQGLDKENATLSCRKHRRTPIVFSSSDSNDDSPFCSNQISQSNNISRVKSIARTLFPTSNLEADRGPIKHSSHNCDKLLEQSKSEFSEKQRDRHQSWSHHNSKEENAESNEPLHSFSDEDLDEEYFNSIRSKNSTKKSTVICISDSSSSDDGSPKSKSTFTKTDDINRKQATSDNINELVSEIKGRSISDKTPEKGEAKKSDVHTSPKLKPLMSSNDEASSNCATPNLKADRGLIKHSSHNCDKLLEQSGSEFSENQRESHQSLSHRLSKAEITEIKKLVYTFSDEEYINTICSKDRIKRRTVVRISDSSSSDDESPKSKNTFTKTDDINRKQDTSDKINELVSGIKGYSISDKTPENREAKKSGVHTARKLKSLILSSDEESSHNTIPTSVDATVSKFKITSMDSEMSFLKSLSLAVPESQANEEALQYRKEFQKCKCELTSRLFGLYNEKVFASKLPQDMTVQWNDRLLKKAGYASLRREKGVYSCKISLSTKVVDSADRLRDTLLHEMCHAAVWVINKSNEGHGTLWKAWSIRCCIAFPEIEMPRRCHSYEIACKYKYICEKCGYSFGRHSKSFNVLKYRCGKCGGNFFLFKQKRL